MDGWKIVKDVDKRIVAVCSLSIMWTHAPQRVKILILLIQICIQKNRYENRVYPHSLHFFCIVIELCCYGYKCITTMLLTRFDPTFLIVSKSTTFSCQRKGPIIVHVINIILHHNQKEIVNFRHNCTWLWERLLLC